MKAKNSESVTKGYVLFAIALSCSILVATGCVYSFVITSNKEIACIEKRSLEYDAAFERQVMLTDKVDSLYRDLALLNSSRRINELLLQNRISGRVMRLTDTINKQDAGEALLYQKMSSQINDLLEIKESIRVLHAQVEQTKSDLQRCIQDNRDVNRETIRKMNFTNP